MSNVIPFTVEPNKRLDMINRSTTVRAVCAVATDAARHARHAAEASNSAEMGSEARLLAAEKVRLHLGAIISHIHALNPNSDIDWLAAMASELIADVVAPDPRLCINIHDIEMLEAALDSTLEHHAEEMEYYDVVG
jgi:hypothetical protein